MGGLFPDVESLFYLLTLVILFIPVGHKATTISLQSLSCLHVFETDVFTILIAVSIIFIVSSSLSSSCRHYCCCRHRCLYCVTFNIIVTIIITVIFCDKYTLYHYMYVHVQCTCCVQGKAIHHFYPILLTDGFKAA